MVAGIWLLVAAVWVVIGTRRQVELSRARLWRHERKLAETHRTIEQLMSEVPRWRVLGRRRVRREIEEIIGDDADLLGRYHELRKELSAWNLLESAATLATGASLYQLIEPRL